MKTWKYLNNQFEIVTADSYRKMLILSADHDAKLLARAAEPGLGPLSARYAPIHAAYSAAYTKWAASAGSGEGGTAAVQAQLDLLASTKARSWDIRTQAVFDGKTPEYQAIWAGGRTALNEGAIDLRIAAVAALHARMQPYAAALGAPLLAEIIAFHTVLDTLRDQQQGGEGKTDADSTALEAARRVAAEMLYGNLGALMDLNRANPEAVADFYDLSIIRQAAGDEEPSAPPAPGPV